MPSPLVSIVVPCHNGERYLEQALQSWLLQSYSNWELIVVDDASGDNSSEVIRRFAQIDDRVIAISLESNVGLSTALNTGFSRAQGDFLTWSSDDNWVDENLIHEFVGILAMNDEAAVVYSDYAIVDRRGDAQRISARDPSLLLQWNCVGPSFLYRRKVQESVGGYRPEFALAEDYDFWLRAAARFRFATANEVLYFYRKHSDSLTSRYPKEIAIAEERAFRANLDLIPWATGSVKADAYIARAKLAWIRGERLSGARLLLNATRYSPGKVLRLSGPATNYALARSGKE